MRQAGRLDAGEVVCIFPEGSITRTAHDPAVPAGPRTDRQEPIRADRPGPPRPGHVESLQPAQVRQAPRSLSAAGYRVLRLALAVGDSIVRDPPRAIHELGREAWSHRKQDMRTLHREFIRQARRAPLRLALADGLRPEVSRIAGLALSPGDRSVEAVIARSGLAERPDSRGQRAAERGRARRPGVRVGRANACWCHVASRRCRDARQPGGGPCGAGRGQLELHHRPRRTRTRAVEARPD